MDFAVTHRYARMSPRKARLVIDLIRRRPVSDALQILRRTPKRAAAAIDKVLRSAMANAAEQGDVDADALYVSAAYVDDGPRLRRGRPGPRGMYKPYKKRTCHITVVVSSDTDLEEPA